MTTSTLASERVVTTNPTAGATATEAAVTVPADHPGRWVGGAIGALASLAAALVAASVGGSSWDGSLFFDWSLIGVLGIPIAFVLGRELLPMARGEGWNRAIGTGLLLGWVAPPLGAIEILAGSRVLDVGNLSSSVGGPIALILLPVALPISFVAIFITIPVGLAWGVLVRLVPDDVLSALRVPRPFERMGVRHALVLIAAALILLELAVRS